jgi:hypothetical protein
MYFGMLYRQERVLNRAIIHTHNKMCGVSEELNPDVFCKSGLAQVRF